MSRPARLSVFEAALSANLRVVSRLCGQSKVWAVAKARAYGHGIPSAVAGFAEASGLAVLEMEEAAQARAAGWRKPILLIEGVFQSADLEEAVALGLDLVVHTPDQLEAVSAMSALERVRLSRLWIKLNTGMNRLGFAPSEWSELAVKLEALRGQGPIGQLGFLSHFAAAEDGESSRRALGIFCEGLTALGRRPQEPLSCANSSAVIFLPPSHLDWVRPGIALYGSSPLGTEALTQQRQTIERLGLLASQRLTSRIIGIQNTAAGERVGYGGRFRCDRPSRIGVAALGYADGYPRLAPDGTPIWIDGRVCPLAGRVSMDLITIDLTDHPRAGLGSEVEFWGPNLSVDQVAGHCQTLGYELLTGVTPRVARCVIPH